MCSIITDDRGVRFTAIPCRARGISSLDHNVKTATFTLHDNISHGDALVCSLPTCRNRGVKFLYCSFCKDAFSKVSFRKQHSHQDITGLPPSSTRKRQRKTPQPKSPPPAAMVTSSGGNGSSNSDAPTTRLLAGNKRPTSSSWASSRRKELNRNQLMEWRNLLMLRPTNQDTNAVSEWLAKIAAVSGAHVPNFSYKVSQPSSDAKSSQGSSDAKSSSSSGCNSSDEAVASSDDDFSISSSVFSSEKQPAKKRSADSSFCSSDSSESYPHRNTTFMGPSQSVLSIDNGSGMEDSVETSSDE